MAEFDSLALSELMLRAAQFCSALDNLAPNLALNNEEVTEFRLKMFQSKRTLEQLQNAFNDNELSLECRKVRAQFRQLVLSLLWLAFYARKEIDRKLFRLVVSIQADFTYLLSTSVSEI
jgi:hypothetical protein